MRKYQVVSADSHVTSPPDCYVTRFPKNLGDRAPRVESAPEGDYWVYEDKRVLFQGSPVGIRYEDWTKLSHRFADTKHGGWDPVERIQDQDLDGVDGEILYSGIVGGFAAGEIEDLEVRLATIRAYNDWVTEYCHYAPHRLFGMAVLPMWDIKLAVSELRRTVKEGSVGALTALPDEGSLSDSEYNPLWSAFEDLDVPAALHLASTVGKMKHSMTGHAVDTMAWISADAFPLAEPVATLIMRGVFERHPKLRLIPAEAQAAWWGYFLQRMDDVFKRWRFRANNTLPGFPSFYFRRNIFTTFQEDLLAMRIRDAIGLDNIMWASDYPHFATTWGRTKAVIAEHSKGLSEGESDKIFCRNALRVYGVKQV